jgi:hypothetical protein
MTKNKIKVLIISAVLVIVVCCTQIQQPGNNSNNTNNLTVGNVGTTPTPVVCNADPQWINNLETGPNEIPGGGTNLCQFHQFSWQWFLALMNAAPGNTNRAYQNQQEYPQLQAAGTNSCTSTSVKTRLFVRTRKDDDQKDDFVLPEDIGQAGGGATIYDQKGNVVFYEVRFSRSECALAEIPRTSQITATMFPAGTTEIKVSYRVITPAEAPNYVTIKADITGDPTEELLGMVGFHLVKSTALHPEFVWATFEHKQNVPECQATPDPNAKPWSFTSAQCAAQLPNSVNPQNCNFNTAVPGTVISGGTPTQICRVYHDGTMTGDNQYQANISDIDMLNTQLVGPSGYITALSDGPLAVLKNYQLVGALWVTDPTKPATPDNQRGSIQLANSTMETTFQGAQPYTGTGNLQPATNCFVCHTYTPGNNIELSHIFKKITAQQKTN